MKVTLNIVLVNPQIPPNTGNIARLCAANDFNLHLVGEIGFSLSDKQLRRAGLDYWKHVRLFTHNSIDGYIRENPDFFLFTKSAQKTLYEAEFRNKDSLVFGSETTGLPPSLLSGFRDRCVRLPMQTDNVRSLNLASSVTAAAYEAIRQISWSHVRCHGI
jgi:tRNA (cytidine/uridine-2'-O-)-methyltransferase